MTAAEAQKARAAEAEAEERARLRRKEEEDAARRKQEEEAAQKRKEEEARAAAAAAAEQRAQQEIAAAVEAAERKVREEAEAAAALAEQRAREELALQAKQAEEAAAALAAAEAQKRAEEEAAAATAQAAAAEGTPKHGRRSARGTNDEDTGAGSSLATSLGPTALPSGGQIALDGRQSSSSAGGPAWLGAGNASPARQSTTDSASWLAPERATAAEDMNLANASPAPVEDLAAARLAELQASKAKEDEQRKLLDQQTLLKRQAEEEAEAVAAAEQAAAAKRAAEEAAQAAAAQRAAEQAAVARREAEAAEQAAAAKRAAEEAAQAAAGQQAAVEEAAKQTAAEEEIDRTRRAAEAEAAAAAQVATNAANVAEAENRAQLEAAIAADRYATEKDAGTNATPAEESEPQLLAVTIHSAAGIRAADRGNTSDPFVEAFFQGFAHLDGCARKTSVRKKTLTPVWDEQLKLRIPSVARQQSVDGTPALELVMHVLDWDRLGKSDILGEVKIPADGLGLGCERKTFQLVQPTVIGSKKRRGSSEAASGVLVVSCAPVAGLATAVDAATLVSDEPRAGSQQRKPASEPLRKLDPQRQSLPEPEPEPEPEQGVRRRTVLTGC